MKLLVVLLLVAASQASPDFTQFNGPFLADTPEVSAEKARFFNDYNRALASTGNAGPVDSNQFDNQFNAPSQNQHNYQSDFAPPGSALYPDGTLANTWEVSKATAEHSRDVALSRGIDTSPWDNYLSNLAASRLN